MVTNGDLPAVITVDFESFYVQTGRRMLSLAFSLTGSWGDAEDLVQEAYAAAHRRWNVVGSYEDPAAWVRRVITNRAVSRWRRLSHELNVRQRLAARAAQTSTATTPSARTPPDCGGCSATCRRDGSRQTCSTRRLHHSALSPTGSR